MGLFDGKPLLDKEPIYDPEIVERMRTTFELYEFAEDVMRQNLRRRHPGASEEEIERRLLAWLRKEAVPA